MNKSLRILLGLAVSAFCFWFLFRNFDLHLIVTAMREADYRWLIPPMAIYVVSMLLRGLRWKIILSGVEPVPFSVVFPNLTFGFFMNNVLPARGGEFVRCFTLSRDTKIPVSSVLGTVVAERLCDMLGLMLVIFISSHLLPWNKLPIGPIAGSLVAGIIVTVVFVVYAKKHHNNPVNATGLMGKVLRLFTQLTEGFLALQSWSKAVAVVLLSWTIWINEVLMPLFISQALHLDLTFFESAGLLTGLSVGVMIPAAPGFVGTYELFGKTVLTYLGKPEGASVAFVVLLHFFHLTMVALVALGSFLFVQFRKKNSAREEIHVGART